jgi:hypothetical protein
MMTIVTSLGVTGLVFLSLEAQGVAVAFFCGATIKMGIPRQSG